MEHNLIRRNFVKQAMLASAGALFISDRMRAGDPVVDTVSGSTYLTDPVNDTINTIQNLHTTHGNFNDKEIPEAEIDLIKESCIRAANSSNMQTYSVVIVRDRKLMGQLCGYQGSCLMIFNVDYNRLIASAGSLGLTYYPGNVTSFVTASINASLVAQTATITARSMGIDSLLTNGIHRGDMERLWKLLRLPEKYCMPMIALVLGYSDQAPAYKTGRLTGKTIFHENTYSALSQEELAEITRQYDDPELHLGTNPDWKAKGHEHYLEWLFKEWLGRDSKPAEMETALLVQLKKRGFVELL